MRLKLVSIKPWKELTRDNWIPLISSFRELFFFFFLALKRSDFFPCKDYASLLYFFFVFFKQRFTSKNI